MYSASDWSMCSGPSWISARLRRHHGGDLLKKSRVLLPGYAVDTHLQSPGIIDPAVIDRLPGFHRRRKEPVIHIAIEITQENIPQRWLRAGHCSKEPIPSPVRHAGDDERIDRSRRGDDLAIGNSAFDDFLGQGSHPNLIAPVPDADRVPATRRGGVVKEKMERRCFARHVPSVLPVGLSIRSRRNPLYCDQVSDRPIACFQVLPQAENRTLRG